MEIEGNDRAVELAKEATALEPPEQNAHHYRQLFKDLRDARIACQKLGLNFGRLPFVHACMSLPLVMFAGWL